MDEVRKNAYRNLLYRAMIDIRTLCQSGGPASYNPLGWYRQYHRSRVAGAIADWLHNLAFYAARDFERFEEDAFWRQFERIRTRFPGNHLDYYQKLFEHFLNEPEHTGIW